MALKARKEGMGIWETVAIDRGEKKHLEWRAILLCCELR